MMQSPLAHPVELKQIDYTFESKQPTRTTKNAPVFAVLPSGIVTGHVECCNKVVNKEIIELQDGRKAVSFELDALDVESKTTVTQDTKCFNKAMKTNPPFYVRYTASIPRNQEDGPRVNTYTSDFNIVSKNSAETLMARSLSATLTRTKKQVSHMKEDTESPANREAISKDTGGEIAAKIVYGTTTLDSLLEDITESLIQIETQAT